LSPLQGQGPRRLKRHSMCLFRIFRSSDDQPIINVNPHKKSSWGSDKDKEGQFGLGFLMVCRFL